MKCLLFEHILAYIINIFRTYDITKNGKPDANGIFRAPKEMALGALEVVIDCFLIGYVISRLIKMDKQ